LQCQQQQACLDGLFPCSSSLHEVCYRSILPRLSKCRKVTPVGRQNANLRRLTSHGAVRLHPFVQYIIKMADSRKRLLQRVFLACKPRRWLRTGLGGNPYARMGSQPQRAIPRI
jgi:hypothetical protein